MLQLVNKTILLFLIPISVTFLSLRLFGFIGEKNLEKSRVWIFHFSPDFEMFCLSSVSLSGYRWKTSAYKTGDQKS